jgi:hypothetical protein
VDINYASRSRFLADCEAAIRGSRDDLSQGTVVRISLESGGYQGNVVVDIRAGDPQSFGTDWTGNDPSRFPARIKAVATALFNCGCCGRYRVSHEDGIIQLERL